jgi:prepilin-type N-terminal cleavage/methylation domain-containing protein
MFNKKQTGFTIVELLIVIVVIGILAAITVVAYNGIQTRARTATITSTLVNAAKSANVTYNLNGTYPAASGLQSGNGLSLAITSDNQAQTFCITATGTGYSPRNVDQTGQVSDGPCEGQSGGSGYCPTSFVDINGYYCNGTIGSVATKNTGAVRLAASTAEVPINAPAEFVGRQTSRDNLIGSTFTVVAGEIYCVSGWAATSTSTVTHTVGLMISGAGQTNQWRGGNNLSPTPNAWQKITGCITIPANYTTAQFWTQNNGTNGTTADAAWYQTAMTLTKQ